MFKYNYVSSNRYTHLLEEDNYFSMIIFTKGFHPKIFSDVSFIYDNFGPSPPLSVSRNIMFI